MGHVSALSRKDINVLRSAFSRYDGGSGVLTKRQFYRLILRFSKHLVGLDKVTMDEVEIVFTLFDMDGSGSLNFDEFCEWWASNDRFAYFTGDTADKLRKAYNLYYRYVNPDDEEGGGLGYKDFHNMMLELGVNYSDDAFDQLDKNGDGTLSFKEFVDWLNWF